jgi:hypothetical protein
LRCACRRRIPLYRFASRAGDGWHYETVLWAARNWADRYHDWLASGRREIHGWRQLADPTSVTQRDTRDTLRLFTRHTGLVVYREVFNHYAEGEAGPQFSI